MDKRLYNMTMVIKVNRRKDATEELLGRSFRSPSVSFRNILVRETRPSGAEVRVDVDIQARNPAEVRLAARRAVERAQLRVPSTLKIQTLEIEQV